MDEILDALFELYDTAEKNYQRTLDTGSDESIAYCDGRREQAYASWKLAKEMSRRGKAKCE